MSIMGAKTKVKIDQGALDRELNGRTGNTARVMAGLAGQTTKQVKAEMTRRAGGAWWPVSSSLKTSGTGPSFEVTVKPTRPHTITPKSASVLVFKTGGVTVFTKRVDHPGSAPPRKLIAEAVLAASKRIG